ncbi:ergothioneine biosynthesis glutamate--cysteine ligase EgtA [Marmoricola sp. URHB0036]|uniref:ergothioneine biosynthesis glutamate--cysteine ligase EgtA n=1 Tax=Marmoricola sp. URHB0036 TaxID=1298863 RepID=UPI00040CE702|nr:ergothioneine biosynthesis glutamate--cysteine ligase EgtA [Marmoricola sp. URHB0036]
MTAQRLTTATTPGRDLIEDALLASSDPLETARQHVAEAALTDGPGGQVGLELEFHLVDLVHPARRPTWAEATRLADGIGPLPSRSLVTLEPGGQIELSTPPGGDVVSAVAALRADREVLRARLRDEGFGAAPLGADLARPVARINPGARYQAMEMHFDALGCAGAGKEMMTATAALQVNLDAGPIAGWSQRLSLIRTLVPMLVAASSTSPYLGGHTSGWHSMRQGTWQGIDHGRSDPVPKGEPTEAWATYALHAPVMLVDSGGQLRPVTSRVSLADWLGGRAPFGRRPTMVDLDYHLTTLFPPVRPRGYVEIRCLDALPDRWWPAVAAMVATLVDDPVAADEAADLCAPVADAWQTAARRGLEHPLIRAAATACVDLAARRAPDGLRDEVEDYAELIASGRTPSGELRSRVEQGGPLAVLEEEAHA